MDFGGDKVCGVYGISERGGSAEYTGFLRRQGLRSIRDFSDGGRSAEYTAFLRRQGLRSIGSFGGSAEYSAFSRRAIFYDMGKSSAEYSGTRLCKNLTVV